MLKLNEAQQDHLECVQDSLESTFNGMFSSITDELKPGALSNRLSWDAHDIMRLDLHRFYLQNFVKAFLDKDGYNLLETWRDHYKNQILEWAPAQSTSNGHRMENEARLEAQKNMLELFNELMWLEKER